MELKKTVFGKRVIYDAVPPDRDQEYDILEIYGSTLLLEDERGWEIRRLPYGGRTVADQETLACQLTLSEAKDKLKAIAKEKWPQRAQQ